MSIKSILVVDDDPLSREFLVEAIKELGFQALEAENGSEGIRQAKSLSPDLVLTDLRMPDVDGLELVRSLKKEHPDLPTVLVTAHGTIEAAVEAIRLGADDFLLKPCSPDAIEIVIQRIDHRAKLIRENQYLRSEIVGSSPPSMVAKSPEMLEMLRSASRIARSKGTVLITGDSGTGKERIAHYIHQNSPRASGPFIRVNCAALSEQLLESELFGHERGAFTGAHKTREGRFELADGGTLLLDEIGEISAALQSKLLRVLEEEEFERVGGNETLRVDVRVIATTNRDLAEEMQKSAFREDLYYRLHVLPIHLSPLRERRDDILPLAQSFAEYYAQQNGRDVPSFTQEALERLSSWSWPGNVRELENVIQRAVVLQQSGNIAPKDLVFGPSPDPASAADSAESTTDGESIMAAVLANKPMADIERVAILATLEATRGNKTEAARRLGLTARTLSNKMKIWRQAGLVA